MTGASGSRQATALARRLADEIGRSGPIPIAAYMARCLGDAEHGYYRTARAIGRDGDFITAPEISQVFGELIGLWSAVVWQQIGSPGSVHLIELGPGRGTMMRDMLRAARLVPAFLAAARVSLVESHPHLRQTQAAALAECGKVIRHLGAIDELAALAASEPMPAIIVANEFIDALAVEQAVLTEAGWRRRGVGLDGEGGLDFIALEAIELPCAFASLAVRAGDVVTLTNGAAAVSALSGWPLVAALVIDYGQSTPQIGDTLQAVRAHAFENPLASPGQADLSASVDFSALTEAARRQDLASDGPVTQAELLGRLGIIERTSRLMAANPRDAAALEAGVTRLLAPGGMGGRFKALGLRTASLPRLPGL